MGDVIGYAGGLVGGIVGLGSSFISYGGVGYDRTTVVAGYKFGRSRAKAFYRSKLRKNVNSVTGSVRRTVGSVRVDAPGRIGSNRRVIGSAPKGGVVQSNPGSRSWLPIGKLH